MFNQTSERHRRTLYNNPNGMHGQLAVIDDYYEGNYVRMLLVNDGQESACFLDPAHKYELVFDYTEKVNRIFAAIPDAKQALLIGGGAFSYPKYYISHYPDRSMTVIELDPEMIEISKEYFFLDDLYQEYQLNENQRLEIYVDDGNHYLKHTDNQYDIILNDAYLGDTLDRALQERKAIKNIRDHLSEDGIYLINVITTRVGPGSENCLHEQTLLQEYFENVILIPCDKREAPEVEQNCILVASNRPVKWLFKFF